MKLSSTHYALLAAFLTGTGMHLGAADNWAHVLTPASIGGLLVQVGAILGAIYSTKPGASK